MLNARGPTRPPPSCPRALILSHLYPCGPSDFKGNFVHRQAVALRRLGCEITVLSPVPWNPLPLGRISANWARYAGMPRRDSMDGIEIHRPRYLEYPHLIAFASSGRRMARAAKAYAAREWPSFPFDLVHAHIALPGGGAGAALKARYNCPLILTIHGFDLVQTIHRGRGCRAAVIRAAEAADRVITVSEKQRALARAELGPRIDVVTIDNGVDPRALPDPDTIRRHPSLVVCLATLIARKNVHLNIEALALLADEFPDLRLRVVGDGPERASLHRLAAERGVASRVEFLGALSNAEAVRRVADGSLFSLPSAREAFGVAYLEAMAMGLPVIGRRGEGLSDTIADHDVGLLVGGDSATELAEAWRGLLRDPDRCHSMGTRGRALVRAQFTWQAKAERILRLYRDLLAEPAMERDGAAR